MGGNERKKSASCEACMRALKWIPVAFITAVILWSYYAYVIQLCIFAIDNVFERIVFLLFYHVLCVLFLWSYWNTIFTPVGTVPTNWRIQDADIERLFHADSQEQQKRVLESCARNLPVTNRTLNGSVRFCEKCKIIKPDRAHHCSVCGTCVLKMDHHCPWVNNCVNFANYKFFVLFLGYALLYCLYVALTSLEYFIRFWRIFFPEQGDLTGGMGRFHILFLFFVAIMFAFSLISLFGYHIYLVLMNRTTLEAFRAPIFRVGGPDKNGYNLGKYANFQEVFGDNWKLWFVPVFSSNGDGLKYPQKTQIQIESALNEGVQQQQQQQQQPSQQQQLQQQSQQQHPNYESMGDTQTRLEMETTKDKLLSFNDHHHPHHLNHPIQNLSPKVAFTKNKQIQVVDEEEEDANNFGSVLLIVPTTTKATDPIDHYPNIENIIKNDTQTTANGSVTIEMPINISVKNI